MSKVKCTSTTSPVNTLHAHTLTNTHAHTSRYWRVLSRTLATEKKIFTQTFFSSIDKAHCLKSHLKFRLKFKRFVPCASCAQSSESRPLRACACEPAHRGYFYALESRSHKRTRVPRHLAGRMYLPSFTGSAKRVQKLSKRRGGGCWIWSGGRTRGVSVPTG